MCPLCRPAGRAAQHTHTHTHTRLHVHVHTRQQQQPSCRLAINKIRCCRCRSEFRRRFHFFTFQQFALLKSRPAESEATHLGVLMLMLITMMIAESQCFPCRRGAGSAGRSASHLQGGFFIIIIIICIILNYPAASFKLCVFHHNCSSSVESGRSCR